MATRFDILLEVLLNPFLSLFLLVNLLWLDESIETVSSPYPIESHVDIIDLNMSDLNAILCMNLLHFFMLLLIVEPV